MKPISLAILTIAFAATALEACGKAGDSGGAAASTPNASIAATTPAPPVTGNAALLAAAEPFEKLTEISFSAAPAVLDSTITEVRTAANGVRGNLASDAATRLDEQLAAIATARRADNRAELAIAAVEGYRILVSGSAAGMKVPAAVKLLDYAGFRYAADVRASPARWADMSQAVSFAREQWASISSQVTDAALRASVEKSLTDMGAAATRRDASAAGAAAQRELALVDDLEKMFASR